MTSVDDISIIKLLHNINITFWQYSMFMVYCVALLQGSLTFLVKCWKAGSCLGTRLCLMLFVHLFTCVYQNNIVNHLGEHPSLHWDRQQPRHLWSALRSCLNCSRILRTFDWSSSHAGQPAEPQGAVSLPPHIQAVFIQNIVKLYASILVKAEAEVSMWGCVGTWVIILC